MLLRIVSFLLETVFFLLIGAALLRAWMNGCRVNMTAQPGTFVMALTSWLVKPLRRVLPASLRKSRVDWASIVAAALLALAYAVVWALIFGVLLAEREGAESAALLGLLPFAVKMLIRVALQTLMILVFGFAILSWVQPGSSAYTMLGRLTEPMLAPLRKVIPTIGGVDLSALVLIVLLQIGLMVLV